jgi:hypothetical protein
VLPISAPDVSKVGTLYGVLALQVTEPVPSGNTTGPDIADVLDTLRNVEMSVAPICSLRVSGLVLLGVARVCEFRIDHGFSVPSLAHYCRILYPG